MLKTQIGEFLNSDQWGACMRKTSGCLVIVVLAFVILVVAVAFLLAQTGGTGSPPTSGPSGLRSMTAVGLLR